MNRKKIESTVRSQNLCSPVTRKNKPGAVKKILLSFALLGCVTGASAQEAAETAAPDISAAATPSTGDYFGGLTRPLTFDRMIPPYALEVTFNKTTHVIFPSAIRYVDLGSADLLAAKADGTENVLRVKAALRDFSRESNLSVITEDWSTGSITSPNRPTITMTTDRTVENTGRSIKKSDFMARYFSDASVSVALLFSGTGTGSTLSPCVSLWKPSTTIFSPGTTPRSTITRLLTSGPSSIRRRSAMLSGRMTKDARRAR